MGGWPLLHAPGCPPLWYGPWGLWFRQGRADWADVTVRHSVLGLRAFSEKPSFLADSVEMALGVGLVFVIIRGMFFKQ